MSDPVDITKITIDTEDDMSSSSSQSTTNTRKRRKRCYKQTEADKQKQQRNDFNSDSNSNDELERPAETSTPRSRPSLTETDRPRQTCLKCGESFNNRYYKKHIKHCSVSEHHESDCGGDDLNLELPIIRKCDDDTATNEDDSDGSGSDPNESLKTAIRSHVLLSMTQKKSKNLQEDDLNTFFQFGENQIVASGSEDESIGRDSSDDFDSDDSEGDEEELVSSTIQTYCNFLGQWQAKNNVSDSALIELTQFMRESFKDLHLQTKSSFVQSLAQNFPTSIRKFWNKLKLKKDDFIEYVSCPACYKLYDLKKCTVTVEGRITSRQCCNVLFPNHTQPRRRNPCGAELLKEEVLSSGKVRLVPIVTYRYKSVKSTLQKMVLRHGYEEQCEHWRTRDTDFLSENEIISDVYDGNIWKDFQKNNFFAQKREYGLMLNIDWFQPYKHVSYSVGAIYMVNVNLPRSERFKIENVFFVGILPAVSHEPPTKTFIEPLVSELKDAWNNGWLMPSHQSPNEEVQFHLALICAAADIPAARKLCGFLGHMATIGCSKCKKAFPGGIGNKNFGGFARDDINTDWMPRTDDNHRNECHDIATARTKTERDQKESRYGTRISPLLDLPYYKPVSMCAIDPMHNLYCGTAKNMHRIWKNTGILLDGHFVEMQEMMSAMKVPSDMGKIPRKIATKFSSFNADEWKNWTLYFSLIVLKKFLPKEHFECWRKFSLACSLYNSKIILVSDAKKADRLMMSFCKKFEQLYGSDSVTPNMHLHGHLKDVVMDLGPVYSFWLFSFERYNGVLGRKPTNKRDMELVVFRRMLREQHLHNLNLPTDSQLEKFVSSYQPSKQRGTIDEVMKSEITTDVIQTVVMSSIGHRIVGSDWSVRTEQYQFKSVGVRAMSPQEVRCLDLMYAILYGSEAHSIVSSTSSTNVSSVKFAGELLGTSGSRSCRSSLIRAFWPMEDGCINIRPEVTDTEWPGKIIFLCLHNVCIDGVFKLHLLANVSWYQKCKDIIRESYGTSVELWKHDIFLPSCSASFIPVQRIKSKLVQLKVKVGSRGTFVAIVSRNKLGC